MRERPIVTPIQHLSPLHWTRWLLGFSGAGGRGIPPMNNSEPLVAPPSGHHGRCM